MTESKFDKFYEFICDKIIYPIAVAFMFGIVPLVGLFVYHTEWAWSIWTSFILYAIAVLWFLILIICLIANKIIEHREYKARKAQEFRCSTCDRYHSDEFEPECYECENGSKYQHILIEKDESEE